jgi:hypothetical protein
MGINTPSRLMGDSLLVVAGGSSERTKYNFVGRVWFRFVLDVDGASGTVVLIGVMFGKVVGSVGDAAAPVDNELALADAVADPIKTHVHGFGSFLFDRVVGDAGGSAVVGDDRGCSLGMSEFFESDALRDGFLAIVVEASHFGFGCAGEHFFLEFCRGH